MMFALTTAPVYGVVASPRAILHPAAAALGRHGAQPQMQFGGFKLPDFKLPGDDGNAEKKGEEQAAPAAADDTKPAASNPFEKLVSAFTPVEVDRDGNVVPDAELPTRRGMAYSTGWPAWRACPHRTSFETWRGQVIRSGITPVTTRRAYL